MAKADALRTERHQELVDLLEERDGQVELLHEETKGRKAEIKDIDRRLAEVRDILAGRTGEQQQIPGTTGVQMKSRQKPAAKAEEAEKCGACGVYADKPSEGCEECDHPVLVRWRTTDGAPVPKFVTEMTGGLSSLKAIVARYGEGATFEVAKPLPPPAPPKGKGAARG